VVAEARPRWGDAEVVAASDVADGIRRITLRREAREPRRAPAGSHLDVQVDLGGGRRDVRSYSIVSSDETATEVSLSVLAVADSRGGSRHMHRLAVGDRLRCTQPLQNFELRPGHARQVLLAGGVGVTALLAMGEVLARRGADHAFVYAGRTRSAMAYLDDVVERHGDLARIHVDDEGTPLDVPALVGEIAAHPAGHDTELYMCGPIRLMDAVRRAWSDAGLPVHHLRFETFGSSGWFTPEEFEVVVPRLGLTRTVRADSTVLETLAEAGVEMMYDCRKGECGLCQVDVVDVDGHVDHRDVFFSADEHRTTRRMCTCVSRAARGDTREEVGRAVLTLDLP
jgi:ferredoxin-NADP reductase